MRFVLTAISGNKYDGEVYEVVLPTIDGRIGVLSHHMPLFSAIAPGVITVRKNNNDPDAALIYFATFGGVIEVSDNTLKVLVDEAHLPDEINLNEAEAAMDRAQKMKSEAKDQISLEHAQSLIDRQSVRLKVAGLKRRVR